MAKFGVIALGVAFMLPLAATSRGQHVEIPEFNGLRAPAGPAFTVLGISPTAIDRPLTPGALGLSFLSSVSNLNELPRDFSLEIAPYWLFPHSRRSWKEDVSRTVFESMQRTASLSIATAKLSPDTTSLAVGLRTSLVSGSSTPGFVQEMNAIERDLAPVAQAIAVFFQENGRPPTVSEIETLVDDAEVSFQDVDYRRVGWFLDLAVAGVWTFPDNIARRGKVRGWSAWLTLAREWNNVSVAGVARYQDNELVRVEPVGDWGVKILGTTRNLGSGFEVLWRVGEDEGPQKRFTAIFDYRIHRSTWVSLTLGEDFDNERADSFIAQVILNLNFDRNRQVQIGE